MARAVYLEAAIVLAVVVAVLALTIGGGELRTYDEALYGVHARAALAHDVWLYPVNEAGAYSHQFTKPPLSIWLVGASFSAFGASMVSLRLPFAIAYALVVLVAWAWGRRLGGPATGLAWALGLALCAAAVRWGRVACIEPMFVAPCLAAMAAHAESLRSQRRAWLVLAGLSLALAFFAKQLAFGIAVVPIVVVELLHAATWRDRIRRLAAIGAVPLVAGGAWLLAARRAVGPEFFAKTFGEGIVDRLQGFAEGQNLRQLNEVARLLDEACAPIPWELGVLGLAVLGLRQRAWHLPVFAATAALVYENATSSLLPWYAFGLVVPAIGGVAVLVAALASVLHAHASGERVDETLQRVAAVAGAAALAIVTSRALEPVISRVDAMGVLAVLGIAVATRWPKLSLPARIAVVRVALAIPLLALIAGRLRDPILREPPGRFETIMRALAEAGVADVALDKRAPIDTEKLAITLFGTGTHRVTRPPWQDDGLVGAYVTAEDVPGEAEPPPGIRLVRAPGAVAWIGETREDPWPRAREIAALQQGGLSWEAEHLGSERGWTLATAADARGGALRRVRPWLNEPIEPMVLTRGPSVLLPAGGYRATLRLRWDCRGYTRRPAVVEITAGERKHKHDVECADDRGETAWTELELPFRLEREGKARIDLVWHHGRVWHDWTRIDLAP